LVVGFEVIIAFGPKVAETLLRCSYVKEEASTPAGFAGVFGNIAGSYFERFGDQSDALASISAKNHANGVHNPYAHMRRDLGYDFCRNPSEKNPFVAGPLKRTDCSLSDGAAVIAAEPNGNATVTPVRWRSRTQVNSSCRSPRPAKQWCRASLKRGMKAAGASLDDPVSSDARLLRSPNCSSTKPWA
jgi:acetyl-CoA C-acetyltransferase